MEEEQKSLDSDYVQNRKMKVAMTRARLPDFVTSDHDIHGVAWLDGELHPGMVIMADGEFVEYTESIPDYFESVKESHEMAKKAKMSDEQIQKNYQRALKGNSDLTLEGYIEMQEKQAKQKAAKASRKAENKKIIDAKEASESDFKERLLEAAKKGDSDHGIVVDYTHESCCWMSIECAAQALYGDVEDFEESLESLAESLDNKMMDHAFFDDDDYHHMICVKDLAREDGYIRGPHSSPNPRKNGKPMELDSAEPIMEMKWATGGDTEKDIRELLEADGRNDVVKDKPVDGLDESLNQPNEGESFMGYLARVGGAGDAADAIREANNKNKIEDEASWKVALEKLEKLMSLSDKDDDEILELAKRIEEYEKIHFPIPEPDEIEETVSLEDAAKMLGPIAPSDMKDFQAQMRASRVQDNFHKSLKAYAETLWGPIGVDAEFEASVKAYAERKWGPFASDIPSHPMPDPIIACEKVVEEFTPEPVERLATDYGDLQTVFVLKWSWHYGEESKEFNNLQDALNYPATVIAYFNEFDFSAAGWELFKRKQSDDVKLESKYELKLTLDRENKNG